MDDNQTQSALSSRSMARCAYAVSLAIALVGRASVTRGETTALPPERRDMTRIVSIGGTLTETLFALGVGDHVVAVDTSSVYPRAATQLPQVGYQRTLSAEGILAMRPTVVFATDEAAPGAVLEQLREAGIELVIVPAEPSIEAAKQRIRLLAQAGGKEARGTEMIATLEAGVSRARERVARLGERRRVVFVYARGAGTLNVSGRGTPADEMLKLAGGDNAIQAFDGFKPLTAEALVAANPEVLLFTTRGLESVGGADGALKLPGVRLTRAAQEGRIVAFDDLLMLGFGPRTGEAVGELHEMLYASTASADGKARPAVAADPMP